MRIGPAAAVVAVAAAAAAAKRMWWLVSWFVARVASKLSSRHHLPADRHGRTATRCSPDLRRHDQLFFCLVSETPQSVALTTRSCKPVQ